MRSFSSYNPISILIYFSAVIFIAMFTMHPIILVSALISGISFNISLNGIKYFFKDSIIIFTMLTIITFTNPLFSHKGITPFFFLNGKAITLEALVYGLAAGIMVISIIYWFKCFNIVMDSDKILYLFGKITPGLSIVLSISLRFIPIFKTQIKKINSIQKTLGLYSSDSFIDNIKSAIHVMSALITWSFESAIDTAISMRARGYELKGRTNFSLFKFSYIDILLTICSFFLFIISLFGLNHDSVNFNYYPKITTFNIEILSIITYSSAAVLMFLPVFIEIKENIRWKLLKYKI